MHLNTMAPRASMLHISLILWPWKAWCSNLNKLAGQMGKRLTRQGDMLVFTLAQTLFARQFCIKD